jgi:hypothetical protein
MRAFYQVKSEEFGTVILRKRKIAKALRWWLREKGYSCEHELLPLSVTSENRIYKPDRDEWTNEPGN